VKQEIIGVYDRAAASYDRVGARFFSYFGDLLIKQLHIPQGARVLDIATGRGALLFPAAEQVGISGQVIGIDLSPSMIAHTSSEVQQRGLNNVHLILMDADQVAFSGAAFDYIVCGSALFFLDYANTLQSFYRLLKPGGCFATWVSAPPDDAQDGERWDWLPELTTSLLPPDFVTPDSWRTFQKFNKPELLADALAQAGFENIRLNKEEAVFSFADEDDWWAWEWSQRPRMILETFSDEALAKFKAAAFEKLRAMREAGGISTSFAAQFALGYKQP
jgi:ubiquinone/menaquinone biosynthesis C-methylase UbiE